ncbi:MAG TPA: Ku protein [Gemmatimonadales bacterium]|nr:Ku protein [Gemmatimonadales bacterium]
MARAIWKGTLGFGLVSIGVELHSGEKPDQLDLDLLDRRDHARIGYQKINKSTGKVVEQKDIIRGYAVGKNRYVELADSDLKAANPEATRSIDIVGFVDAAEIPPIFFDRPYYVTPGKGSERAFALFREVLQRSGKVGLARLVIHTRQYVAAIYPYSANIVVQLLRYEDELKEEARGTGKAEPSGRKSVPSRELQMGEQLVESMTTKWEPSEFTDTYRKDLLKLIQRRAKSGGRKSPVETPEAPEKEETKVIDLMAALKKSLAQEKKGSRAKTGTARRPRARASHRRSA